MRFFEKLVVAYFFLGHPVYRAFYAGRQRLRSRLLAWLFECVWYGPARVANQQISTAGIVALPDNIYNWVVDFLENHAHCTKYAGVVSAIAVIKASVIQGSAIGPAS